MSIKSNAVISSGSLPAISDLVARIITFPSVRQVILFGSRAKGTYDEFSDIDIAVTGVEDRREWAHIRRLADVEESPVRTPPENQPGTI